MRALEIKAKSQNQTYSILVGNNILKKLSQKVRLLCPKTKKIALIFDKDTKLNPNRS